jgi:hypothetical protein
MLRLRRLIVGLLSAGPVAPEHPLELIAFEAGEAACRDGDPERSPHRDRALDRAWRRGYQWEFTTDARNW